MSKTTCRATVNQLTINLFDNAQLEKGGQLSKKFSKYFLILHWDKKFQKWLFYSGLHFSRGKKFFSISNFSWVCTHKHRKRKKCVYTRRIFFVFCVSEYKLRKNWKLGKTEVKNKWNLYFQKFILGVTIISIVKLISSFVIFECIKVFIFSWNIVFWSYKLKPNENQSITKFKCVGINLNYMIFSLPYQTSSVTIFDFWTNRC